MADPAKGHPVDWTLEVVVPAREELLGRGVEASEIVVFDERDGGTFFGS